MIFEGPAPSFDALADHVRARLHLVPRFRQKLAFPPLETGRPLWVDDPSFNLEYHVRDTALPAPGSEEQLRALAARVHSQALDRSKPLWEMWLVHGLDGGRFAIVTKTHHALVDGVSGVDLATVLFDLTREPAAVEHGDWAWTPQPTPSGVQMAARGMRGVLGLPLTATSRAIGAATRPSSALHETREALEGLGEVVWAGLNPAPTTPLNVEIGPHRRLVTVRQELAPAQGDQERAGRHGERRRAHDRHRRVAEVAALARRAHRGAGAARARAGLDPGARRAPPPGQPARRDARAAARLHRGPGRPAAGRAPGDGRAQGVQAGGRRRGAGRHAGARAADDPGPGLAAELLDAAVQPARHQRAGPAVPPLHPRARAAGPVPGRLPAQGARARRRGHVLRRRDGLRPARRLRRDARPRRGRGAAGGQRGGAARRGARAVGGGGCEANGASSRARTSRPRTSSRASTEA